MTAPAFRSLEFLFDKSSKARRQFSAAILDFPEDFQRHIARPTFGGIEGDDTDRIIILALHQITDDGFPISGFLISLPIGAS